MAKSKLINISLNKSSDLQNVIKQLEDYSDSLNDRTELFVKRLADIGIKAGELKLASHPYGSYISFTADVGTDGDTFTLLINASDKQEIVSEWWHGGQVISNTISPTLMAEFGAGWLADVKSYPLSDNTPSGVGRGTHSMFGHGNEDDWYWDTPDKQHHFAHDEENVKRMTPTHPMYATACAIRDGVTKVAREVFGNG